MLLAPLLWNLLGRQLDEAERVESIDSPGRLRDSQRELGQKQGHSADDGDSKNKGLRCVIVIHPCLRVMAMVDDG